MRDSKILNIVVSGASSDIAVEVMKTFSRLNHSRFFLIARNLQKLNEISDSLRSEGATSVEIFQSELDSASVKQNITTITEKAILSLGSVDVLFIAQGIGLSSSQSHQDWDKSLQMIDVNFSSAVMMIEGFRSQFITQQHGTISVISSVAGDRGRAINYLYGSTKAAVTTYLQGLRSELHRHHISVVCIKPGFIRTKMVPAEKKSIFVSSTTVIAPLIYKAILKGKPTIYVPRMWYFIMKIVKCIPFCIMSRLKI